MKAVFDTSSFFYLVNYYLPLDKSGQLKEFVKAKFEQGEIILIDKVYHQCKNTRVTEILEFLTEKKHHIKTEALLPDHRFYKLLKHDFLNPSAIRLNKLNNIELEAVKNAWLEDADCKLIIFCQSIANDNPIIVTEETRNLNDKKEIKKIPLICDYLEVNCCNLPTLLCNHYNLEFVFNDKNTE